MNQRVPSWDLDDPAGINAVSGRVVSGGGGAGGGGGFVPVAVAMSDQYYEVAELTWEKGNISSHDLNRPAPPPKSAYHPPYHQHHKQLQSIAGGGDRETLEAVVGEAAVRSSLHMHLAARHPVSAMAHPWLRRGVGVGKPADALVPCAARADVDAGETRMSKRPRVVDGLAACASQGSAAPGPGRGESTLLTLDATVGGDDVCGGGFTTTNNSTSLELEDRTEDKGSPETENTSIAGGASDSRCFSHRSQSQRDGMCDEEENVVIKGEGAIRSSISTKRSRAAAIHNESERKRRDRINQKMKTLQKLVPNSSKADKASMLDEAIDYLKQLQAQVQMMSRMSSMMMPMGMAMPQLQMSVMAQMAQMAQFGLSMMNMNMGHQSGYPGLTPPMMHTPPFHLPVSWDAAAVDRPPQPAAAPDAFSAFLACQAVQKNAQQPPNSMEAYNRMMAMYQKLNQQQQMQQDQPSNSRQ